MNIKFAIAAVVAATFFGIATLPQSASASDCSVDEYDHNGSIMEVQICSPNAEIAISYIHPRQGIRNQGVASGTLFFDGIIRRNGEYSGTARVFSRQCGDLMYGVSGRKRGNQITLKGLKPVRDRSCNIVEDRNDTLVFTEKFAQQRPQAPRGPDVVAPTCPRGFVFFRGQCVRGDGNFGNVHPRPRPIPNGGRPRIGNWLAIAGAFGTRGEAIRRSNQLGIDWKALPSNECPNLRRNLWIAAAGPFNRSEALNFSDAAAGFGAYIKECN